MTPQEHFIKNSILTFYYRDPEMTVRHRERGLPAWEWSDGDKSYWENNQWHRLDGLAVDWEDYKYHYLNGKQLFAKL